MANIVALVGRPNVGKSTLFNRLVEGRRAIVDDMPGVTRNPNYGQAEWRGVSFSVVDTGGYVFEQEDRYEQLIRRQVEITLSKASVVIFLVDVHAGLTGYDKAFADLLRRLPVPTLVAANKSDTSEKAMHTGEFYALGLGEVYPISAENGGGTGELLDALTPLLAVDRKTEARTLPGVAILGRPNVGKSSLLNALLGEERSMVTDEAGTTRDTVHSHYNKYGKDFILIDTAGIRRKNKAMHNVEFYSVMRAIRALEESDVCLVLVDAQQGLIAQDINIIRIAQSRGKAIVIMVNKWDLLEKETNTARDVEAAMRQKLAPASYIPIVFASAHTGQRLFKVVEKVMETAENRAKKIPSSQLNNKLLPEIALRPPAMVKGKMVRIKHVTQARAYMPSFVFFCNLPQYVQESYKRFLENKIRAYFGFEGAPIRIFFRKKSPVQPRRA